MQIQPNKNIEVHEARTVLMPLIRKGDKGQAVKVAQKILIVNGYLSNNAYDANFNPKTETAVKNYQRRHGLTVDGEIGSQTWEELIKNITRSE